MASAKENRNYTYDWDNFDVGNLLANNSEGFFQFNHSKQEGFVSHWQQPKRVSHITIRPPLTTTTESKGNNIIKDPVVFQRSSANKKLGGALKEVPKAYSFKEIYEQKKQKALQKLQEEERKLREFHSRPMPNFQVSHKQYSQRTNMPHMVTSAITPNTLKISRALEEKRKEEKAKLQEQQEMVNKKEPKPKVRSIAYLKEPPFVPKKSKTNLEIKPFNFSTQERAEKRKIFNAHLKEMAEKRKIQELRERVQQIEAEVEKQRRLAIFKARPNPFRKYLSVENVSSPSNPFLKLFDS